jgi:hypothetical protein
MTVTESVNKDIRQYVIDALGIKPDQVYVEMDDWHSEISIDLELLKAGEASAFSCLEDVHASRGASAREFYGVVKSAWLPHGSTAKGVIDFCVSLLERHQELTAGLGVGYVNGKAHAMWDDDAEGVEKAMEYWGRDFTQAYLQEEINCVQVYDLADEDNMPFVREALDKYLDAQGITVDVSKLTVTDIYGYLKEIYSSENDEPYFIGQEEAAEAIVDDNKTDIY